MLEDAEEQGYHLKLVSGYVSKEDQEAQHQAKVQELMKEKGYSKIKAEDEASPTWRKAVTVSIKLVWQST